LDYAYLREKIDKEHYNLLKEKISELENKKKVNYWSVKLTGIYLRKDHFDSHLMMIQ
jgi:hypothetical protein